MQAHHDDPAAAAWLALQDAADRFTALATRARVSAQANAARLLAGLPPLALPAGPATASEVVDDGPLARLLLHPARGARSGQPLLVVASLINRYYVLDLLPERSLVSSLCERGFDVYVLDWKAPGAAGPRRSFADYLDGAIADAAALAARRAGTDRCALLGYCMGGTLAAAFAARRPSLVQALVLLGAPIDFHASGELARWTERGRFDADLLMDVLGNMPPWLMQSGFKLLSPLDGWRRAIDLARHAGDEVVLRQLVALEAWLEDNVAFPGGVYREYIRALYQGNALVRGTFTVAGARIALRDLTAPLLNVVALRDRICEPPSSRALMPLAGSRDAELLEFDVGHIGLTTSARAQRELWPRLAAWLVARCK